MPPRLGFTPRRYRPELVEVDERALAVADFLVGECGLEDDVGIGRIGPEGPEVERPGTSVLARFAVMPSQGKRQSLHDDPGAKVMGRFHRRRHSIAIAVRLHPLGESDEVGYRLIRVQAVLQGGFFVQGSGLVNAAQDGVGMGCAHDAPGPRLLAEQGQSVFGESLFVVPARECAVPPQPCGLLCRVGATPGSGKLKKHRHGWHQAPQRRGLHVLSSLRALLHSP